MPPRKQGAGRSEELRPTSGAEWRKLREEGVLKRLPGGLVARLRVPRLDDLLHAGEVPDVLSPIITRMVYYGLDDEEERTLKRYEREPETLTPDELRGWRDMLAAVARATFVEPRIVDDPQADDEISIEDVPVAVQWFTWTVALGGATFLQSFPDAPQSGVAAVHDGEGDEPATEHPAAG